MPPERYVKTTNTETRIDPGIDGLYSEYIVENGLSTPIVCISKDGMRQTVVPPVMPTSNHSVQITIRSNNGSRINKNNGMEKAIATDTIVIDDWQLLQEPVYVAEIDMLVCRAEQSKFVDHPHRTHLYHEAMAAATKQLGAEDMFTTIRVYANDPNCDVDTLYINIFGDVFEVPVTHIRSNTRTVVFALSGGCEILKRWTYMLDDIFKAEGCIESPCGYKFYIGATPGEVNRALEKHKKSNRYSQEFMDTQIKNLTSDHDARQKHLRDANKFEKEKFDMELSTKELRITELAKDLEQANVETNRWKSIYSAETEKRKMDESVKQDEQKTVRAELAIDHENAKMRSIIIKTASGAGIAILTLLIKAWIDKSK